MEVSYLSTMEWISTQQLHLFALPFSVTFLFLSRLLELIKSFLALQVVLYSVGGFSLYVMLLFVIVADITVCFDSRPKHG